MTSNQGVSMAEQTKAYLDELHMGQRLGLLFEKLDDERFIARMVALCPWDKNNLGRELETAARNLLKDARSFQPNGRQESLILPVDGYRAVIAALKNSIDFDIIVRGLERTSDPALYNLLNVAQLMKLRTWILELGYKKDAKQYGIEEFSIR